MNFILHYKMAAFFLILATSLSAQQELSLQECIDLALRRNLQHQRNQNNLVSNRISVEAAQAPFGFNMDANFTAPA